MTIPYIEAQLCAWGTWANRQVAGAIGFPSISPMFNDAPRGDAYGSSIPLGFAEYVYDTDEAVRRLSNDMRDLCVQVYQVRGKTVEIARRMGVSRSRLYQEIDVLHTQVMGHLNDIAAET